MYVKLLVVLVSTENLGFWSSGNPMIFLFLKRLHIFKLDLLFCERKDLATAGTEVEVEGEVTLRLTVSQYVLASSILVGLETRHYFLSECCFLKFAVLFLWGVFSDERMGLQFAVQSLNCPSRAEPLTIFYCLI
jgi:hypothetical protein